MAHNYENNFNAMLQPPMLEVDQQQICAFSPSPNVITAPNATMPSPTSHPWSIENMPWAQPENLGIMHFQARTNFLDDHTRRALLHAKRKSDPTTIEPPQKQFITEEKITAHFNGLHISNNFAQNENAPTVSSMDDDAGMSCLTERPMSFSNYQDYRVTAKELEEKLRNANRITLCEGLKKLQEEQKKVEISTLIPEALMSRIEKPCTALVLWQPPPILELLHRKNDNELKMASEQRDVTTETQANKPEDIIEDVEFETDDIDDFIDNNNTCSVDYNNFNGDMDEDL